MTIKELLRQAEDKEVNAIVQDVMMSDGFQDKFVELTTVYCANIVCIAFQELLKGLIVGDVE